MVFTHQFAWKNLSWTIFQQDAREELCNSYYSMLCNLIVDFDRNRNFNGRIVYTPMHGVGANYIDRAFQVAGFLPVIHVKDQRGKFFTISWKFRKFTIGFSLVRLINQPFSRRESFIKYFYCLFEAFHFVGYFIV